VHHRRRLRFALRIHPSSVRRRIMELTTIDEIDKFVARLKDREID